MNEYLIHPMIFYLLSLIDKIMALCLLTFLVASAFLFIFAGEIVEGYANEKLVSAYNTAKKIAIVSLFFLIFTPSEATIYRMMAASYLTKENIHNAVETVDKVVDKLFIQLKEERRREGKH